MLWINRLGIFVLLISLLGTANATVTVNADKSMQFNGVTTFPIGMYQICDYYTEYSLTGYESCATSLGKNNNFTYSQIGIDNGAQKSYDIPTYEAAHMYWNILSVDSTNKSLPYFMGYYSYPEEPYTPEQYTAAYSRYVSKHSSDPDHPVWLAMWTAKPAGSTYKASQVADIVLFDGYQKQTGRAYPIADFIFAWERATKSDLLNPEGYASIDAYPKSMHFVFEGLGYDVSSYVTSTKQELRGETYWGITAGANGIEYWCYKCYGGGEAPGLVNNVSLTKQYNNLAGELTSPEMQHILLLPTTAYSWDSDVPWNNIVQFNNNPTKNLNVYGWIAMKSLSYRYKIDSANGKKYLIVANKNNNSITTTITISGLTGSMIATTLGLETEPTMSSRKGRVLNVNNGVFTDTFDGYAGHVYEITASGAYTLPLLTLFGNTKSNTNSTVLTLNTSETVTLNAKANQTITTWNWYNNGQAAGNNTNSYTVSFSTGGTKNISVRATNANGTSNMITWIVSVLSTPSTNSTPTIISRGNTKTSSDLTSFSLNTSETVTLNATANQTITAWNWYNNGLAAGNNTNSYTVSFSTGGTKNISVRATNANGTSNMITWIVSVLSTPSTNSTPTIISRGNTKTSSDLTLFSLNTSETVTLNATANQTITTWNWYNNGQAAGNNANSYTVSFSTGGTKNISVRATNANGTSNMITWIVSVLSTPSTNSTPTIISRGNTKTSSDLTLFSLNTSETVTLNATPNQTITTWNWYNNGQAAGNNTNSYTVSFSTEGTKNISVNAANSNGSSNMITWTVSVSSTSSMDPKIGIGGVAFSSSNSNFNHTVLNKGDGKVTVGLFADNCDDGTSDWSAGKCIGGKLAGSNSTYTTLRQNVSEYTNVTLFFETVEYGITPWTVDARGHTSRASINQRYQVYKNTTHDLLGYMPLSGVSTWLSNAATTRNINTVWYNVLDLNGNNLKFYSSTGSFENAFSSVNLSATNSSYPTGNFFFFWMKNMTLDNIRMIESGRNTGSITVYYDSGTNNQTHSLIVNATTPTNTNYTVSYRQKYTGSWIPIGGTYSGNQSLPITGTKYQETEVNITLYGNGTSFPEIETVEFSRKQVAYPRYDVNENGTVEINDLTLVGQYLNKAVSFPYPRYDVNMDGLVNIKDLSIVGKHFGEHL